MRLDYLDDVPQGLILIRIFTPFQQYYRTFVGNLKRGSQKVSSNISSSMRIEHFSCLWFLESSGKRTGLLKIMSLWNLKSPVWRIVPIYPWNSIITEPCRTKRLSTIYNAMLVDTWTVVCIKKMNIDVQ